MAMKTTYELLRDLECAMNDKFRVMGAVIDNNAKEIDMLNEELTLYRTIFKYVGQIAKAYKHTDENGNPEPKTLVEMKKYLRDMFGEPVPTDVFMKILIDRGYANEYKPGVGTTGYRSTSKGIKSGWLVHNAENKNTRYRLMFTHQGVNCIVDELVNSGWEKL